MNTSYLSQIKIFNHLDRLQEWLKDGTCFPITIEIDPTNQCTRNCANCAGNRTCQDAYLSLSFMKNMIRQIKPFCKGLIFTGGGEPLCNNDTLAAMKYAKTNGLDIAIITNADLIDKPIAKKIVQYCTYIRASYNDDKVWNKIKLLIQARNKTKSSCTIGIGLLTSRHRQTKMKNFVEMAKNIGVDYAQFRPFHLDTFNANKSINKLKASFNDQSFRVVASEYKYTDMRKRSKKIKIYSIPFADNFRTVIAADGKIYPDCWTRGMKNFCLGDLNKDSFSKIWKSQKRNKILNSKLNHADCPIMCYHDPLNELLWNIWQQNRKGKHVNFV